MILLTAEPIDIAGVLQSVRSDRAGATALFLGSVRSPSQGRPVAYLEYECYPEMAQSLLEKLAEEAQSRWNLLSCAVVHRIGRVPVGEMSVAIACSAVHRAAAFEAAQWLIDQIKQQVPIWKKEFFTDGAGQWVPHAEASSADVSGPEGITP